MGVSALGKLLVVGALAAVFFTAIFVVVWLSLRGDEVKVPEVIGKDFYESEKEFAALGLRIKRRATRYSKEKPNTILEQLPKAGETVKTGQTILVVLSEANPEGNEEPATIETPTVDEDAKTSASGLPAKPNKNSNVKRPVSTSRDQMVNKINENRDAGNSAANSTSSDSKPGSRPATSNATQTNRVVTTPTPIRVGAGANAKTTTTKTTNTKTGAPVESRDRRIP